MEQQAKVAAETKLFKANRVRNEFLIKMECGKVMLFSGEL